ncbi:MAG: HesA/MoeB/ThiF family protein [PVC group bacterium]|nr:HesA/MoeB/ThiF family protein [PVC group bacterium]
MNFNEGQLKRYSRHILLPEIGTEGQSKISAGKVLVIGTGGLGSPGLIYLAAAGVGTIGIADADKVDLSNLQRQVIHFTADIGRSKVLSAKEKIEQINPDVNVIVYEERVVADNIADIIKDYDFVIDATDNFSGKFLINDACVIGQKPFSHAGVLRFEAQTMTYLPGKTCYRCIFNSSPPENTVPSGAQAGIFGTVPGVIGTIQAAEALKFLTGAGDLLTDQLLIFNAKTMDFRKVKFNQNKNCPVCGYD